MKNTFLLVIMCILSIIQVCRLKGNDLNNSDEDSKFYDMTLEELMNIQINVSSTKTLTTFNTPSTVTIIDKDMIRKYNFLSLPEALETVAGMDVNQTIIDKNVATSRGILQNFYANKVLILINNIPTWQPIYGVGRLERIDLNDVNRIEVLKGPASVLYGSNAYSGVINIVLKEIIGFDVNPFARIGIPEYGATGINIRYEKDIKLFLSFNSSSEERAPYKFTSANAYLYKNDSIFSYSEKYETRNFNFQAIYKEHLIFFNLFNYDHSYLGAHPSYIGGAGGIVDNQGSLVNYRYDNQLNNDVHLVGNISYDFFERTFPLTFDKSNMIYISGDRASADFKINYNLTDDLAIEFGGIYENRHSNGHDSRDGIKDTLISHNLKDDDPVQEWSAMAQANYNYGIVNILLGSRYTNNDYFGGNISSRFTGVIEIADKQSLKLIYGSSFRVPTLFELYFDHPTVVGNKELKPETSESFEIAYLAGFNNIFFQVLGYYGIYNNMIQRVNIESSPPSVYINAPQFEGYGAEFELKYQNPKVLNFFINYNFITGADEGKFKNSNRQDSAYLNYNYRYVPDHKLAFGANKEMGNFFISLTGKYLSKTEGHLADVPSQFIIDAHIGYRTKLLDFLVTHTFSAKNLNDSDMLTPEYIRQTPNVNSIPTTGFGRRFIYSIVVDI